MGLVFGCMGLNSMGLGCMGLGCRLGREWWVVHRLEPAPV